MTCEGLVKNPMTCEGLVKNPMTCEDQAEEPDSHRTGRMPWETSTPDSSEKFWGWSSLQ